MPPRRPCTHNPHSKTFNSYSQKKKRPSTIYNQDTLFSDKICAVFPVEVDKSGVEFSAFIKTTPIQNNDKKLNHSFNHLLSLRKTKEHKTYINASRIYVARTTKDTSWFSTQITPPSICTIWYFGTISGFLKNTEIGKYKEIAAEQLNTQINDQYQFFGNGELDFEYIRNRETVFENDSIGDQKNVSKRDLKDDSGEDQDDNNRGNQEDDSKGDQESDSKGNQENNKGNQPEIIELLSNEDQTPEIIEISSDEKSQIPEIIELSSDKEVFEKKLIAISREQTPETAEIKLNL
ncbi:12239_t:CDS:2 [Cetraspora pellucida]|uniref:12239_t:CDS:1 n=1 Tax=Cetraspora pellucida TaxID=1433469 RepID=A0ACA9KP24_9GLOM|nr:12239_t:CDS:2 [Cetraspora pellucida]